MSESYSEQLVLALRIRDVPGQRIGQVVAEVEAYTADSGQDPMEAFGPVQAYSDTIAAQLRREPSTRGKIRDLLWGYPPAVGSLVLVDGLWGVLKGGRAELTIGDVVVATLLPLAVLLLVTALTHARPWAYYVTAGLISVVGGVLLWAGGGLVLMRYPAWVGLACGAIMLGGGLTLVMTVNRDPVIDPRTGRDRYPASTRLLVLVGALMVPLLALLSALALLSK